MKKYLEKLPTEGLLIIIVVLITLMLTIYFTKIDSVIESNKKIVVTDVNQNSSKDATFTQEPDIDSEIVLDKPEPEIVNEEVEVKRKVRLFFIKVTDDGEIILKSVIKSIYVGKTPLSRSIEALLSGPDTQDINRGLLSLIPAGTELLSVSLRDGVAYLNFNELFRFNPLGVEGYKSQIRQIVYTATEYETVDSVQFKIDGFIQEYLGPEGVYIGEPLSRDDIEL